VSDPRTGARIGAPLKLFSALPGARLDFAPNDDADLGVLYTRLPTATPVRKIAYKAIKPDTFFVVSGQDGPVKFYTRFDKNPAGTPPMRGFTFACSASQIAALDRIAIAVANSFEPFPESAGAPAANAAGPSASNPAPSLPVPQPAATALVVGARQGANRSQDERLSESDGRRQAGPDRARDAATGLAIIAGDFASSGGRCLIEAERWSASWRRSPASRGASAASRSLPRTCSSRPTRFVLFLAAATPPRRERLC
jgi:hypothetical protein